MSRRGESLVAVLLGALGLAGPLALWVRLYTPVPCPVDGKPVRRGARRCPHCFSELNWS
ncbi:MAG TPA: hypothetical protein VMG99_08880 [Thermoplasmata archaeon]|nr:hypothetical protein [Thermoplasmata archaeon]